MKADIINYDETLCPFHILVMQCNLKIAQYNKPINIKEQVNQSVKVPFVTCGWPVVEHFIKTMSSFPEELNVIRYCLVKYRDTTTAILL